MQPLRKWGGKKGRKIFESLEATARKSSIYGKVKSDIILTDPQTLIFLREFNAKGQNSFTMESLILAQDER